MPHKRSRAGKASGTKRRFGASCAEHAAGRCLVRAFAMHQSWTVASGLHCASAFGMKTFRTRSSERRMCACARTLPHNCPSRRHLLRRYDSVAHRAAAPARVESRSFGQVGRNLPSDACRLRRAFFPFERKSAAEAVGAHASSDWYPEWCLRP